MNKIKEIIKEQNPEAIFMSKKFDDALVGTGRVIGELTIVAVYDTDKCIKILIEKDHMDPFDALNSFNETIQNSPITKHKPIFINDFRKIKDISIEVEDINKTLDELL